ncbi:AIM24 family protein [Trichocoleus sp. FACHB-591]|uniref:AIM24 family protein n=1 Tax=Trichocoleus sp. FACHB-591 TaxID=2692872 RepID=UPI0016822BA6|nr:AIM24 family protein [Trichocoleus sp. FACHB-591]MBD2096721.1 AIM24 family protein [Trichocoleus sp. FACHB-591]
MTALWYYKQLDQEVVGPLSPNDLVQAVAQGLIAPETEVRQEPGEWMPAAKVSGLFERATRTNQSVAIANGAAGLKPSLASQNSGDVIEVLDSAVHGGFKVEVLGYRSLSGSHDPSTAQTVFFANQAGLKLKQVKVTLQNHEVQIEAGALHYMHGRLEMDNKAGGVAGLGKAMLNKMLTNEAAFKSRYRGTGELYLEPSFGHFLIYQLRNEELIADKGLFFCSDGSLEVGVAMQKNLSSAFLGGEGLFQTRVKGNGICVFELPVPANEVRCVQLNNETLKVDGNFALMRTGNIEFTVEKSTKSLFGTLTSGEGLLQTFRGTGKVWLAPTQGIYQRIQLGGMSSLSVTQKSSNTTT